MTPSILSPHTSTRAPLAELKEIPPYTSGASKETSAQLFNKLPPSPSTPHARMLSLPARLNVPLTPSTSTVAFSSSPNHAISSSPVRDSTVPPAPKRKASHLGPPYPTSIDQELTMDNETTLIFGRHRHKTTDQQSSSTNLQSSIPSHIHHLSSTTKQAKTIYLPRLAKHASRVHAVVEYIQATDQIRVLVLGQNGVRVKSVPDAEKSSRLLSGQVRDLSRSEGNKPGVEINFYGSKILINFPAPPTTKTNTLTGSRSQSPMSDLPSSPRLRFDSSLPPSSPPMALEESEAEEEIEEQQIRLSSPLSSEMSEEETDLFNDRPSKVIKLEQLAEVASEEVFLPAKAASRAVTPAEMTPPKPESIDLPALLASTVVFSGSSKLSLPDLVKAMLEAQPSLKEFGDESLWSAWSGVELENNAMFGKVSRVGKDASGHPLLPHYFYNPDSDPDATRSRQLGSLVRPLRAAQRAGGKAIDWRPVGSGRRRY